MKTTAKSLQQIHDRLGGAAEKFLLDTYAVEIEIHARQKRFDFVGPVYERSCPLLRNAGESPISAAAIHGNEATLYWSTLVDKSA